MDGGIPDGWGIFTSLSFIAEGTFVDGYLNGYGRITFLNIYELETAEDGTPIVTTDFELELLMNEGAVVEGHFVNGILNGFGRKEFDNGFILEGIFTQCACGVSHLSRGIKTLSDGTVYEGFFAQFMHSEFLHGNGRKTFPDGTVYEGFFSWGTPQGTHRIVHTDGSLEYIELE